MANFFHHLTTDLSISDATPSNLTNTSCLNGVVWVLRYFGECVETQQHFVAFLFGLISLCFWFTPLIPQIYKNYKRGKTDDSLSIYFLGCWVVGDSCNLIGAILANQLQTQIFVAAYYIFQDVVILLQIAYYKGRQGWSTKHVQAGVLSCLCLGTLAYVSVENRSQDDYYTESYNGRRLMGTIFVSAKDEVGYALGGLSSVLYVCGRMPQFYKNYTQKSVEGLSLAMFVIMIGGNFFYWLSVFLAGEGGIYTIKHLPWLMGSFTCCILDSLMVCQIRYYTTKNQTYKHMDEPCNEVDGMSSIGDAQVD